MSKPLYQLKAEFFKTLGHPAWIQVLELLSLREHAVAEMVPQVAELLVAARRILLGVLSGQAELLEDLRATSPPVPRTG